MGEPGGYQRRNKDKNDGEEIQVEGTVDGTLEKGLGPTDTLVQTGNRH